jgi:hypothetical protein
LVRPLGLRLADKYNRFTLEGLAQQLDVFIFQRGLSEESLAGAGLPDVVGNNASEGIR